MATQRNFAGNIAYDDLREWLAMAERLDEVGTVKGAAESGAIGAPAAIVSAIEDALRPLQVRIRELPVTPARLHALIQAATHA